MEIEILCINPFCVMPVIKTSRILYGRREETCRVFISFKWKKNLLKYRFSVIIIFMC